MNYVPETRGENRTEDWFSVEHKGQQHYLCTVHALLIVLKANIAVRCVYVKRECWLMILTEICWHLCQRKIMRTVFEGKSTSESDPTEQIATVQTERAITLHRS